MAVGLLLWPGVVRCDPGEDDPQQSTVAEPSPSPGISWELPGRVSIYDLQFGPASYEDNQWKFLGNARTFNAGRFKQRLTMMIRFSYAGTRADIPLKFVVRLPDSRQYEETVNLTSPRGSYTYQLTIHRPEDFIGTGSVYLYYGFSMVDVLDFSIIPGS